MSTSPNPEVQLLNQFFEKGLEGFDPLTKTTVNNGGAKLWWQQSWKRQEKVFFNERLFSALRDLPASLYVMSRIRLTADGKPEQLPNGRGIRRDSIGLMIYSQFNQNDKAAQSFAKRVLEVCPELEGYVLVGSSILPECPNLANLTKLTYRDSNKIESHIRLEGCLFLILPSGSDQGSQYWGYRTKATTRSMLNQQTTANVAADDVDLSNLGL